MTTQTPAALRATIPLSDLSAHLPALVAGRAHVRLPPSSVLYTLIDFETDDGGRATDVLAADRRATWEEPIGRALLVLDAHTTRALAVVLAEAVGLDVSGGVVADIFGRRAVSMLSLFVALRGVALDGATRRHDFRAERDLPALADIDPAHPAALGLAIVAALRATPARGAA